MNDDTTNDTDNASDLAWYPYEPDEVPAPGDSLLETLEALEMSQSKLAARTGLTLKHINQIVKGNSAITPATAIALERATGMPAAFWNTLEADYQDHKVRTDELAALSDHAGWLDRMPLKALRDRGHVTATRSDPGRQLQQVLAFFGVGSLDAWERAWDQPAAAFLQSGAYEIDAAAVAAWLRLGELAAEEVAKEVAFEPFDRAVLRAALPKLRAMTVQSPDDFFPELVATCASAGVCLVVVPDVVGTRASGASRFISPTRAVVQLSNRGKRNDKFWFALFHELGHLLLHSKKETFMRFPDTKAGAGAQAQIEQEANDFAGRLLIPAEAETDLAAIKTPADAVALAKRLGIAPAIVAGRHQHEANDWRFGQPKLFETYEIRD
ncbi:HigA family addiction module antitoxin [Nocardioides sp. NBC_00368]|uniref:HigA family addiction module antitoxin n=1 Tax=Nocardioides sp. NBC_00368 TaxID=2976000 RepID=UPI002E21B728